MAMTKERKLEIAYAALKTRLHREFSFRDLDNIRRDIGNLLGEKEFVEINLTKEEICEFTEFILREIFEEQISQLK